MRILRFRRRTLTLIALLSAGVVAGGGLSWLRTHLVETGSGDAIGRLLGSSRADLEARLGRSVFTARDWVLGTRQSIRSGGLRMDHLQLVLRDLKPRLGVGSASGDPVLIWIDDPALLEFGHRVTTGELRRHAFPTSIAVDLPGRVVVAQFDTKGCATRIENVRPSFVVVEPQD